ncbi:MAG TPA: hypothetical protein VEP90_15895 [Methylomirabilota bacterium]|nr:hypothetical protein [Methylomirabilota bacterium]
MKLTRELALAAAQDEANRQMRKNGRSKWSKKDYILACKVFNCLWPMRDEEND